MIQLIQPNLSAVGRVGYCLEYAGPRVFGTTYVPDPPWAWKAYQQLQSFHPGRDIPSDVSVPMWYSYWATIDGEYANYGHVTISVPNQGIYSSPWKVGTDHAVLPSIEEVERIYGVTYVGWSKDILQVKVVEENDMSNVAIEQVNEGFLAYWTPDQIAAEATAAGKSVDDWKQGWVGTESNAFIDALASSKQFENKRLDTEQTAAELKDAQAKITQLEASPTGVKPYSGPALFVKS